MPVEPGISEPSHNHEATFKFLKRVQCQTGPTRFKHRRIDMQKSTLTLRRDVYGSVTPKALAGSLEGKVALVTGSSRGQSAQDHSYQLMNAAIEEWLLTHRTGQLNCSLLVTWARNADLSILEH